MPANLKIGVGVFVDYVNGTGSARITIISQQMDRILDPTRIAWYPYRAIESALHSSLSDDDPRTPMHRAIGHATPPMRSHYEEIAEGWQRWLARHRGTTPVPVGSAAWSHEGLTVNLRRNVGLRGRDGRSEAAFLYLKKQPLTQAGANAALRIMDRSMDRILPGARAAVIDVRRSRTFHLRSNQKLGSLDDWIASEATGYLTHWNARAPEIPTPDVPAPDVPTPEIPVPTAPPPGWTATPEGAPAREVPVHA